jgi:hypothetical protein
MLTWLPKRMTSRRIAACTRAIGSLGHQFERGWVTHPQAINEEHVNAVPARTRFVASVFYEVPSTLENARSKRRELDAGSGSTSCQGSEPPTRPQL